MDIKNKPDVTVVLPAFNEEARIVRTIKALKRIDIVDRIIVIDDGSSDGTFESAMKAGIDVYGFNRNRGKGEALNFGINQSISPIISFIDADLCESASEVTKLIIPVLEGEADVTIGCFPKAGKKGGLGLVKGLARAGVKAFTGKEVNSVLSGQRVFRREVLDSIGSMASGYGAEVGMTIDVLKMGFKIKEIDVNMSHAETGRNLSGIIHRGKQFVHVSRVLIKKYLQYIGG